MYDLDRLTIKPALTKDFKKICCLIKLSYSIFDPKNIIVKRESIDLNMAPWIWYGDPELTWIVAKYQGEIVGFFLWRNKKRYSHMHSLFTHPKIGSLHTGDNLRKYHEKIIIKQNPEVEVITGHVPNSNVIARFSHLKYGFIEVNQKNADITEDSGLGDWIRNCIKFNNWPLPEGLILVVKYLYPSGKEKI